MPRTFFAQSLTRKSSSSSFNFNLNNHHQFNNHTTIVNNNRFTNLNSKREFWRETKGFLEKSFSKVSRQAIKEFYTVDLKDKYVGLRKEFERRTQKKHIDENYPVDLNKFYSNAFIRVTSVDSYFPDKSNKKLHEACQKIENFIKEGLSLVEKAIYCVRASHNGINSIIHRAYPDHAQSEKNDIEGIRKLQLVLSVFAILARQNKILIYVRDNINHDELSSSNFVPWGPNMKGLYLNNTKKAPPVVILTSEFDKEQLFHECTHAVEDFFGLQYDKVEHLKDNAAKWVNQTIFAQHTKIQFTYLKKENISFDEAFQKDLLIKERWKLAGNDWIDYPSELEHFYTDAYYLTGSCPIHEARAEYVALLSKYPYSVMQSCWPNTSAWFKENFFPKCEAFIKENDTELYNAIISNPEIAQSSNSQLENSATQLGM